MTDHPFPFGLPPATAFYATLYVATFALHQAFMHYVLAGSLYVGWTVLFPGSPASPRTDQPLSAVVRDWMPFVLSAAITAGVAPLLFVQILYPKHFYTANLLLTWRWVIIIPVLIIAFYTLYLLKLPRIHEWPFWQRGFVVAFTAGAFVFVGFVWTANHLLSLDEKLWIDMYLDGIFAVSPVTVFLRMLVWLGGAFPSLAVIAGWQLWRMNQRTPDSIRIAMETRRLTILTLTGLVVAAVATIASLGRVDRPIADAVYLQHFGRVPLILVVLGGVLQVAAWLWQAVRQDLRAAPMTLVTCGWLVTLLGISAIRECVRLSTLDVMSLATHHRDAAEIGGLWVFVFFAILNAALIIACVAIVYRETRRPPDGYHQ